ncbi:MAG: hypothetical protein RL385_1020 [Pseudomonadota bacterium]|jgi:hypothetical protein
MTIRTSIAEDPFLCAQLVTDSAARHAFEAARSANAVAPSSAWERCTTCSDPGFDELPFRWPGESDVPGESVVD